MCVCVCVHVVRKRDVDGFVQPAWMGDGRVNDVMSVGGSNDEHVLLGARSCRPSL